MKMNFAPRYLKSEKWKSLKRYIEQKKVFFELNKNSFLCLIIVQKKIRENYSEWKISRDQNWWAHVGLRRLSNFLFIFRIEIKDERKLKFYWAFFYCRNKIEEIWANVKKVLKISSLFLKFTFFYIWLNKILHTRCR